MNQKTRRTQERGLHKLLPSRIGKTDSRQNRPKTGFYPLLSGAALVPVKNDESDSGRVRTDSRIGSGGRTTPARTSSRWDWGSSLAYNTDYLTPSERAHLRNPFTR